MKSKGFGDTLEKVFKATGVSTLVEKTTELLGIEDCGCTRRKDSLNKFIPYNKELVPPQSLDFESGIYIFNRNTILNNNQYIENDKIFIDYENPNLLQFKQLFELGIITKQ